MAVGTALAIGAGAAALAGGISGAIPKTSKLQLDPATQGERNALGVRDTSLGAYGDLVGAGANQGDVSNAAQSNRDLAALLAEYQKTGGVPTGADLGAAQNYTQNVFAPRQTALDQNFIKQNTEAERLSAQLGRPVNDPIIQAKLRTGFMQQQDMLNSEATAFGSQYADQISQRRVGYANDRNNVMNQLATQAFQNRAALFGMGSQVASQEQQFRLSTAGQTTGGGLSGALGGAIGGAGLGLGIGNALGSIYQNPGLSLQGLNYSQSLSPQISQAGNQFQAPQFGQSLGGGGRSYSLGT